MITDSTQSVQGSAQDLDTAWCLRWLDEHCDPCEWNEAMEAGYKKAHDEFLAAVSQ